MEMLQLSRLFQTDFFILSLLWKYYREVSKISLICQLRILYFERFIIIWEKVQPCPIVVFTH